MVEVVMDDTNGNQRRLELGSVRDSMTKSVVTLRPEQSLDDAALELERGKVAGGPVVKDGVVVGVVTLRDLFQAADVPLHAAATSGPWLRFEHVLARSRKTVGDVMTRRALTVEADQPLAAAAVVMSQGGVNRVPVIDQERRVAGILTRDDVVAAVARAYERAGARTDESLHPRMAPD
jgi:CBS domain-containing membrane protein